MDLAFKRDEWQGERSESWGWVSRVSDFETDGMQFLRNDAGTHLSAMILLKSEVAGLSAVDELGSSIPVDPASIVGAEPCDEGSLFVDDDGVGNASLFMARVSLRRYISVPLLRYV